MIPIRDSVPSRHFPIVTVAIIAANVLVFLYELRLSPEQLEGLFTTFGVIPGRHDHPEWVRQIGLPLDTWWPFLTSMFLHAGWLHLIGNMWILWIFGDNVEDRMGPARYLFFYVL